MPEISRFLGISVRMFYDEHGPPHFHAVYAEYAVVVDIHTGIVQGRFPPRALRHLLEWYHQHQTDLMDDWRLAEAGEPLKPIAPGYRVWLRFDDGLEGEADLENALRGPIFEPLRDPARFAEFTVDLTLTWPNGADLAPESLHERVLRAGRRG